MKYEICDCYEKKTRKGKRRISILDEDDGRVEARGCR